MALVQLAEAWLMFAPPWLGSGVGPTQENSLINAASQAVGHVLRIPRTGNIARLSFATATVTTGATVNFRIETVTGAGIESGTLYHANADVAVVIADSDDNVTKEGTFASVVPVTQGDEVAVILKNPAASFGNMNIVRIGSAGCLYGYHIVGGTKVQRASCIGIEYDDGAYPYLWTVVPFQPNGLSRTTFNNASTPDERGNKFQVPIRCRASGLWVSALIAAGADFAMVLYDAAGNQVATTATQDGDAIASAAADGFINLNLTSPYTLETGVNYYQMLKPTTANNVRSFEVVCSSNAKLGSLPGGTARVFSSRTDAGAFSDTTTKQMMMGPIIDQIDAGAGSVKVHPGMTAGMRG